ncbi:hypothetical protein B4U84_28475 [Westiellopsis prolifica IICB1]|nr:hypothetical protein B4U84_28475 [Westiellopsis prolifica IICB1]
MDNFGIKMKKIVIVTIFGSVLIPSTALAQSNLCRRPNTMDTSWIGNAIYKDVPVCKGTPNKDYRELDVAENTRELIRYWGNGFRNNGGFDNSNPFNTKLENGEPRNKASM